MNKSDWINVIGIVVEIVLWVIDCIRGLIKKKQDDAARDHDKDIEAEPKWGINNLPLEITEGNVDHEFRKVYFYIFTISTDGELRVNSTEDLIKYFKIKDKVELFDPNRLMKLQLLLQLHLQ